MVKGLTGGLARTAPKHRLHGDGLGAGNSPRAGPGSALIPLVAISQMG